MKTLWPLSSLHSKTKSTMHGQNQKIIQKKKKTKNFEERFFVCQTPLDSNTAFLIFGIHDTRVTLLRVPLFSLNLNIIAKLQLISRHGKVYL